MKKIITIAMTFYSLATSAETKLDPAIGYKNIPWGTEKSETIRRLGKGKRSFVSCNDGRFAFEISEKWDIHTNMAQKLRAFLPGFGFELNERERYPQKHQEKFSQKEAGDGCAIFFDKKFIGFTMSPYAEFNSTKDMFEEKYGKFQILKEGMLASNADYFENDNTIIVLYSHHTKGSKMNTPHIYYFSKKHAGIIKTSMDQAEKNEAIQGEKNYKEHLKKMKNSI